MAQNANQLYSSSDGTGSQKRLFPSSAQPKSLAAGATSLAVGTAMAFNTSTSLWVSFVSGGANGTGVLGAFVFPEAAPRHASDETTAVLMMGGRIHFEDIPIITGYTLAQLKTALRDGMRAKGFIIEGLDSVY